MAAFSGSIALNITEWSWFWFGSELLDSALDSVSTVIAAHLSFTNWMDTASSIRGETIVSISWNIHTAFVLITACDHIAGSTDIKVVDRGTAVSVIALDIWDNLGVAVSFVALIIVITASGDSIAFVSAGMSSRWISWSSWLVWIGWIGWLFIINHLQGTFDTVVTIVTAQVSLAHQIDAAIGV